MVLFPDQIQQYHYKIFRISFYINYLKKKVATIFLDLKKVFYVVDHDILLVKLECIGLRGDTNLFIKSYLENRNIIIRIDNTL